MTKNPFRYFNVLNVIQLAVIDSYVRFPVS